MIRMLLILVPSFKTFVLLIMNICAILTTVMINGKNVIINSKDTTVVFAYREGIEGESGLHKCASNEACNIVHKRFWMPTLTERLCRCPGGHECPWHWNNENTNDSSSGNSSYMYINNRSILQFCSTKPLENMKRCVRRDAAVTVLGNGDLTHSFLHPYIIKANCKCPKLFFWKLQKFKYEADDNTVFQVFKCVKQWMCESLEFCGHVRADLFSIYYRCTCPEKHWCIFTNKTQQHTQDNVQELIYSGKAYNAYCIPHK